ncbi:MAG TPA: hypothetical protein VMD59_15445, partial [Acidimicrobiales bacterium]|nr:hypothetical protein [Acidimicrobiales bacterium]
DAVELLGELRRLGPRRVVLVDELGGGVASEDSGRYRVPPFPDPSPPLDRTGGTDAFGANVLAALIRGLDLPEAVRRGAISFMSVSHGLGSQSGLPGEEQLEALLAEEPGFGVVSC